MSYRTKIASVTCADGTVYLHTHRADSSEKVVAALKPYVGRMVRMTLPNNYGYFAEHRVRLVQAEGTTITIYHKPTNHTGEHDAMTTAGLRCVRVEPAREWSAKHYGESRAACGAKVRDDDSCTTVIKDVRCLDCLEEINRAV